MKFILILLLSVGNLAIASVEDNSEDYANRIIKLRQEVESLNLDYESKRESFLTELKSLSLQKADMETQIRHEELKKKNLIEKISAYQKVIGDVSTLNSTLKPMIQAELDKLLNFIQSSLPVKSKERSAAVNQLKTKLSQNEISALMALKSLWSLVEDEKRFSSETLLLKQSVSVGGQKYYAEVAKYGSQLLYFRLPDGRVGKYKANEFIIFNSPEKSIQAEQLFVNLKRQIKEGEVVFPL